MKLFKNFFLIALLFFLKINAFSHPVHYSITNIDYNTTKKSIFGSIKVFKDDIIIALIHNFEKFILEDTTNLLQNQFLHKYLINNFQLYDDINYYELTIEKLFFDNSFLVIEFSIKLNNKPQKLCIYNNILFDIYLDQSNMLIFSIDNKDEKGYMIYSYTGDICIEL